MAFSSGFEGTNGSAVQLADGPWHSKEGNPLYGLPGSVIDGTTTLHAKLIATDPVPDNQKYCILTRQVAATDTYGRLYLYIDTYPGTSVRFFYATYDASRFNECFGLRINATSHKLDITQTGPSLVTSSVGAMPLKQWIRIEWHLIYGNPGSAEVRIFHTNCNATIPDETLTANGNFAFGGYERVGAYTNNATNVDYFIDAFVNEETSWPGPNGNGAVIWNGTAWVNLNDAVVWNGSAWVTNTGVAVWDGSVWKNVV